MEPPRDPTAHIPDFKLPASTGQTLGLDSFKGKVPLVVAFIDLEREGDRQLLEVLNTRHKDFGAERSQILAVARLTARETREVSEEMDLSVPLLADASGAMARAYDAEERPVAIVADKEGRLLRRFDPLPVEDDVSEVTDALLYAVRAIGTGSLDREAGG